MRRAYSYIRFSSRKQLKGDSLRRQLEDGQKYCEANNLVIDTAYKDLGVSAHKARNLTLGAFSAFHEAVVCGTISPGSVLLLENLDRLSRAKVPIAFQLFLDLLNRGIEIVTFSPVKTYTQKSCSDIAGILEPILIFMRGHEESERKHDVQIKRWEDRRAKLDRKKATGMCPSWLRLTPEKTAYTFVEDKAAVVRRIFQLCVDGMGLHAVAKLLNTEGVPCIGGRSAKWYHTYIGKVLNSRAAIGEYHQTVRDKEGVKTALPPVPGYYPPVVTEAVWHQAQAAMSGRKIAGGGRVSRVTNLFTGLVRDARDGSKIQIQDKGAGLRLISLGGHFAHTEDSAVCSFPYEAFEDAVLRSTKELKVADLVGGTTDAGQRVAELAGRLAECNYSLSNLQGEYQAGKSPTILRMITEADREKEAVAADLERAKAAASTSEGELLGDCQTLVDLLHKTKDDAERQRLRLKIKGQLRGLIEEVWVLIYFRSVHRECKVDVVFKGGVTRRIHLVRGGDLSAWTDSGEASRKLKDYQANPWHAPATPEYAVFCAEVQKWKNKGLLQMDVAKKMGVSTGSLKRFLDHHGTVEQRTWTMGKSGVHHQKDAEIKALLDSGKKQWQIALELQMPRGTVAAICSRQGWKRKK